MEFIFLLFFIFYLGSDRIFFFHLRVAPRVCLFVGMEGGAVRFLLGLLGGILRATVYGWWVTKYLVLARAFKMGSFFFFFCRL